MRKIIMSVFLSLLSLFGISACNEKVTKKEASPIDYSETTWLEIKGYKTPGYDVHMSVGYGGEGEECKFFSFGLGRDVSKSNHMEFDAEISKDDLYYTLRYPLNFKQGKCEFWAGSVKISMEEYNDLDINKYPKDKAIRNTQIFDRKVLVFKLNYREEIYEENFNLNPLNLYCQREVFYSDIYADETDEEVPLFGAICHNTTSYVHMHSLGARYQVDFLKKNNPLMINLLISEDLKCSKHCDDNEMEQAKSLGVKERMIEITSKTFPTENTINQWFIPSEKLFDDFKKKNKIKE